MAQCDSRLRQVTVNMQKVLIDTASVQLETLVIRKAADRIPSTTRKSTTIFVREEVERDKIVIVPKLPQSLARMELATVLRITPWRDTGTAKPARQQTAKEENHEKAEDRSENKEATEIPCRAKEQAPF